MSSQSDFQLSKSLALVASLFFLFAVFNRVLPPNAFSATVMIFDYEFGFLRRGLFGEAMNFIWGDQVSRGEVYASSAITTLCAASGVFLLARRWLFSSQTGLLLAILLFSSFAFRGILGTTGYLDMVLLCLMVIAMMSAPDTILGLVLRMIACAVGVLVHEIMLPYFAVFLTFDAWLGARQSDMARASWRSLLVFGAGAAAFVAVATAGEMPTAQVDQFRTYIEAKSVFSADKDAMDVIGKHLADNLAMMEEKRQNTGYRAWIIFDGLPLLGMSIWLIWLNLKAFSPTVVVLTKVLMIGAILAPLSLNVIAFDVIRFGSISVLVGFLCLISQMRATPDTEIRLSRHLGLGMFLVVLALNVNTEVYQLTIGTAHDWAFPWVLLQQLEWLK